MIEIKSLNCYYSGQHTVKNINLTVEKGEMVSLVGPSGCGKTTLLKSICGLQEELDGSISIADKNVMKEAAHKRSAIMVFQEYLLYPHLNVIDNICFGLKMRGIRKKKRREMVKPFIEKMELQGLENRYPNELSGGQRQRVALARALAVEPKVLLLDEPFSNLDERLRDEMRRFVCDLQEELAITTIFVTHDIEEALMSSQRVVVMLDGEIQQIDTPQALYEKPVNYRVAKMLGNRSFLNGQVIGESFEWFGQSIPCGEMMSWDKVQGQACGAIPPNAIKVHSAQKTSESFYVKKIVFGGSKFIVSLEKEASTIELLLTSSMGVKENAWVTLEIDWSQAQVLSVE